MKRLTKIIRLRITEEESTILKGKNISKYIREALLEKLSKDYPTTYQIPF